MCWIIRFCNTHAPYWGQKFLDQIAMIMTVMLLSNVWTKFRKLNFST